MANSFERDFGYLMPFLDRLAVAAQELPDAQARAELASLLASEKTRFERIRALLAGAPGQGAAPAVPRAPPSAKATEGGRTESASASPVLGVTVGSLRPSR